MVDLLVLIHGLVDVGLDTLRGPHDIPLVALGLAEAARLHHSLDQLGIGLHHLEEHLELRLLVLTWLGVAQHVDALAVYLDKNNQ